jgi:signal transduction histidine kinase
MQEVFINLIINAVQAIKDKQGFIRLSAKAVDDEAPNTPPGIEIKIADSGAGIPEPIQQQIFDPFFTTKDVGAGTGLGLSIVYGIVKKHGGTITVRSAPGQGAQFIIRLSAGDRPQS